MLIFEHQLNVTVRVALLIARISIISLSTRHLTTTGTR